MGFTTLRKLDQVLVLKQVTELGPGTVGPPGRDAYQMAVINGFTGTLAEWLDSLVGPIGPTGKSNYEVAKDNGFEGTELEWLDSITGPVGPQGPIGLTGPSAYDVAVLDGFTGTQSEWLESLVGPQGISAYHVAVENGFTGDEAAWLASLIGPQGEVGPKGETGDIGPQGIQGEPGKTSYQHALDQGFVGTLQDWLDSLVGPQGDQGIQGPVGETGPKGDQGEKGEKGDTGDTGPKGDKGDTGDTGPEGPIGAGIEIAGSVALYADLPSGLGSEDAGTAYFVEADGKLYIWDGSTFPADGMGIVFQGPQGEPGPPGADGQDGAPGEKGEKGDPGDPGADGKSAYEVAVDNGFIGSEQDWLDSFNIITSVNGKTGAVVIDKSDVGLANVDNTSDLDKPISTATQDALDLKANTADISAVGLSNDYEDLDNKPVIPDPLGPPGSTTQVVFNNGGNWAATSNFTYQIEGTSDYGITVGQAKLWTEGEGERVRLTPTKDSSDDCYLELANGSRSNYWNINAAGAVLSAIMGQLKFNDALVLDENNLGANAPTHGQILTIDGSGTRVWGVVTGNNSVQVGVGAVASGMKSVAIGNLASASTSQSTALGVGADASGSNGVAIGRDASVTGTSGTALGSSASATGNSGIALGRSADATGSYSAALGTTATAGGDNAVAIGYLAQAPHNNSAAIGPRKASTPFTSTTSSAHGRMTLGYQDVEVVGAGGAGVSTGLILVSPNGTKYRIRVNDAGTLSANQVLEI